MPQLINDVYVPSEGDPSSKLWIIGEAPGAQEEYFKRPFIGDAGEVLETCLGRAGFNRKDAFITNLCHFRPVANKFELLLGSRQLQDGLAEITELLQTHKPNCIATLGNWPTFYLTNKVRKNKKGQITGIAHYRGSVLSYSGEHIGELDRVQKVIPTLHPAFVLRNPSAFVAFDQDIKRIVGDSTFPELRLPEYQIIVDPDNLEEWVDTICAQDFTACDIEAVKGTTIILCVGFSCGPNTAVVIPHGETPKQRHRDAIAQILVAKVPKCFHFGTYDATVLRLNNFEVNSYTDDTIVQAHILAPELPRSLEFLTSVLTRQPYYKGEGRATIPDDTKGWSAKRNKDDLYIYNGKDVCVTHEIKIIQEQDLKDAGLYDYYNYRMELQHTLLDIGDTGLFRDETRTQLLAASVRDARGRCAIFLRTLAGYKVRNIANKEMCKLLYDNLKLPKRHKTDRRTGKQRLTTDEDALISLLTYCNGHIEKLKRDSSKRDWMVKRAVIELVLKIRGYNKLLESYFDVPMYADGNARSLYKVAGPETGRASNVKYVDGSGLNVQTIPRSKLEVELEDDSSGRPQDIVAA